MKLDGGFSMTFKPDLIVFQIPLTCFKTYSRDLGGIYVRWTIELSVVARECCPIHNTPSYLRQSLQGYNMCACNPIFFLSILENSWHWIDFFIRSIFLKDVNEFACWINAWQIWFCSRQHSYPLFILKFAAFSSRGPPV